LIFLWNLYQDWKSTTAHWHPNTWKRKKEESKHSSLFSLVLIDGLTLTPTSIPTTMAHNNEIQLFQLRFMNDPTS
jgi:hypothetical protein